MEQEQKCRSFRLIRSHRDLEVYQGSMAAAMQVFELSKQFPREEMYSLTDQIRRSSRSVTTSIVEAWRKRRYVAVFINKLSDAEMEAAETQAWLEFAVKCGYVTRKDAAEIYRTYERLIRAVVVMITQSDKWLLPPVDAKRRS